MIAGQKRVKQYMANMQAYLDCIDAESAAIGEEQTDEQRAEHVQMYNAGVDAMESLAAQFNAEVKAYKASNN
jgi:phage tail tape-measure protein